MKLFSIKYFLHDFIKITGALPALIFFRPKKIYESERAKKHVKGGALIVSNHTGMFDPIFLIIGIWYRRARFLAAKDLFFQRAFTRFLFRYCFMCIPIDRKNFGIGAFREIVSHLKNDELLVMFPEGHINESGETLDKFKSGMVLMAQKSEKPMIPVYIKPRKRFFERLTLAIGEPIDVKELSERLKTKDPAVIAEYVRGKEERLAELCSSHKAGAK